MGQAEVSLRNSMAASLVPPEPSSLELLSPSCVPDSYMPLDETCGQLNGRYIG